MELWDPTCITGVLNIFPGCLWWVLPFDPTDSVKMSGGAAGTRMVVRVSQEAIHLTFKGVGLAVPAFMSAKTLLNSTRFMLPRSHFMHPAIVSLLRLSESMAAVAGTNPLQTTDNQQHDSGMHLLRLELRISAVSAAMNEVTSCGYCLVW